MKLYMFRTVRLSIIRSLFIVHPAMVHVIQVYAPPLVWGGINIFLKMTLYIRLLIAMDSTLLSPVIYLTNDYHHL